ncbi:hypothetical protein EWM64_g4345 [Hericium alpestre]|uniref:Uncharacterized protein n=1 Tax=Hericium alpestre TaxID=135208 RepID=A0A4Z0A1T2_9AGAM|nr:hypothetical protein EWM64_g4345 [Hericium alpestre]
MGPVSDAILSTVGDSILVEVGMHAGFKLSMDATNDLVFEKPLKAVTPAYDKMLETTSVKTILITLKYKHTREDASLGFFRSSLHKDNSLFSTVKDYLAVEKGWFNPYLFASGRRPIIPRSMTPDIIFCHGPFLGGTFSFQNRGDPPRGIPVRNNFRVCTPGDGNPARHRSPPAPLDFQPPDPLQRVRPLAHALARAGTDAPPHSPRAAPHSAARYWSKTAPAPLDDERAPERERDVLPAAERLPRDRGACQDRRAAACMGRAHARGPVEGRAARGRGGRGYRFEGIVSVLFEYLDMCVDWGRAVLPEVHVSLEEGEKDAKGDGEGSEGQKKDALRTALRLLVAGAVRSGKSKAVKDEVDKERSGVAMWRIP